MAEKVTQIPRKVHGTTFATKYPRLKRGNEELASYHLPSHLLPYVGLSAASKEFVTTKEAPFDGHNLIGEFQLGEIIPRLNRVLLYRILKGIYGDPGILGGYVLSEQKHQLLPLWLDWGYVLQLPNNLTAEIRSVVLVSGYLLRIWSPEKPDKMGSNRQVKESVSKFVADINDVLKQNLHLFSEEEEIKDAERVLPDYLRKAFKNIYAEKYQAAEKLLELANLLDKQPDRNDMSLPKPGEQMPPMTTGYLYLASAMFFFVALEALINTLYKLLLRTDFSDKNYERLTTRDLDLRIIGIHLFCQGFKTQPITPISDLWSKILQLRDFRNDIFHGNITDEDIHYAIPVDMFLFYYSPSHEFRGRKKEPNPASDIPRCMSRIDYDAVLWIKGVVDDTVSALLSAMETETQRWFSRWLSESHVMPLLPDKEKTA